MLKKIAELANNVEFNLNNFNNINDFNHLTDIDIDRNNENLQPYCFNVDPRILLQISLADNIYSSMSLNICSLKSNFLNLQLEITNHFRPSVIIGISETKITNEIETFCNIAGYNMFTNNNQSNKGGVELYIKNSIHVMVKPKQTFIQNGIETIFAELNKPSVIITVGLVYKRSVDISTKNFSIALEEIISSLDPNIKTYIMGDFNINRSDYSTSPRVEKFLNLMISRIFLSCNYPSNPRDTNQLHFN